MKPIGKRVLVKQDEAPVMLEKPAQNTSGLFVTEPDEMIKAVEDFAKKEGKNFYEVEGTDIDELKRSISKKEPSTPAKKPNTGIIVSIGDEVDIKGFKVGDHVKFTGGTPEYNDKGEEFLLLSQDGLLLNLSES